MSDENKKEADPEVDIKFTADTQIREYFKKKGIVDAEDSERDKTSTIELGSQASDDDDDNSISLEMPEVDEDPTLIVDTIDEADDSGDIPEINTPTEVTIQEPETHEEVNTRLIFFDYKSEFFAYLIKELDQGLNYKIVEEFEELPRELQENQNVVLFLNYSAYPKLCSQLIPKVKTKFKKVKIVIVAKNLTPDKIQAHKSSPEGVHEYLSFPFSRDDFFRVISEED